MKKKLLFPLLLLVSVFLHVSQAPADDCRRAEALYRRANAAQDTGQKIRLYRESIKLCPTVAAYYKLGLLYMENDRFHDALAPLEEAAKLDQSSAEVFFLLGDAYMHSNQTEKAYTCFKIGLRLKPVPIYKQRFRQMRVRMSRRSIRPGAVYIVLDTGLRYRSRGYDITPSVDVKVHFDFDKSSLSPQGEKEALILGEDLRKLAQKYFSKGLRPGITPFTPPQPPAEPQAPQYRFKLIGHTDSRGTPQYNHKLSLERAQTVKQFLVDQLHFREASILTEGKGKQEPLVQHAQTKEEHQLNRRVEVLVIEDSPRAPARGAPRGGAPWTPY